MGITEENLRKLASCSYEEAEKKEWQTRVSKLMERSEEAAFYKYHVWWFAKKSCGLVYLVSSWWCG